VNIKGLLNSFNIMKKTLQKIRSKSPEFRLMLSLILAVLLTGVVAVFWGMSLSFRSVKSVDQAPFDSMVSSIKGTVSTIGSNSEASNQAGDEDLSGTQIINVDNPPADTTDASSDAGSNPFDGQSQ